MRTKTLILTITGLVSVILLASNQVGTYWICDHLPFGGHEGSCPNIFASVMLIFYPFIPLFLFSLITYKMCEEVFRVWRVFSIIWIPLTMFLILIAPEYGNAFFPVEKGTVGGFLSLLYVILSLLIITWKHFSTRHSKSV